MPGRSSNRSVCRPFGGRFADRFPNQQCPAVQLQPCAAAIPTACENQAAAAIPFETVDTLNNDAAETLAATPRENRLPAGVATHYFVDGKIYNREGLLIGSANLLIPTIDRNARENSLARLKDASEVGCLMKITTPSGQSTIIDPNTTQEDGKPIRIAFGPPPGTVATFSAEKRLTSAGDHKIVTEVYYTASAPRLISKIDEQFNVISTSDGVTLLANKEDGRLARLKDGRLEWKVAVSTGHHYNSPNGEIIYGEAGWVEDKCYRPAPALKASGDIAPSTSKPDTESKGILPPYPPPLPEKIPETKPPEAKLPERSADPAPDTKAADVAKIRAGNGWILFDEAKFAAIEGGDRQINDQRVNLGNGNYVKLSFAPTGSSVTLTINDVAINFDTETNGALKWKTKDERGVESGNNPARLEIKDGEPKGTRDGKVLINDLISKWTELTKSAAPTPLERSPRKLPKDFQTPETFEEGIALLKSFAKQVSAASMLGVHAFHTDERTAENPNGNRWLTFRVEDEIVTYHFKPKRPFKILPNGVKMELVGSANLIPFWERSGSNLEKASLDVKQWFADFEEKLGVAKP